MEGTGTLYLGIEGGGTRTVALLADGAMRTVARRVFGPGNARLLSDAELEGRMREIAAFCGNPTAIGVGLAGVRGDGDRARIAAVLERVWKGTPAVVTHDLEIALRAGDHAGTRVLVLSGTGSCCYGRTGSGKEAKTGGWGHLLGDLGSGYDIALTAIRRAVYDYDRKGKWGILGRTMLRDLLLNTPEELIGWSQGAAKAEISAVTKSVFEARERGDKSAVEILGAAAETLARDAAICAGRLGGKRERVRFFMAGSVLLKQSRFAAQVAREIRRLVPASEVETLEKEGAWGAARMAAALGGKAARLTPEPGGFYVPEFVPADSPTEQRNPRSMNFDKLSVARAVELMLSEEEGVAGALRTERNGIERAVRLCSAALAGGGRIFYAGAGTSGRLGVLDASECPPTFRVSPELVQGIMAGGRQALWQAVEGAEDDAGSGAEAVRTRGVGAKDVLVGIAASGRTPFVWGALAAARAAGAKTVLLHFNPALRIAERERPTVTISPNLGPEVLTGSTRLKCGTATKLVLNMITTIAMTRAGKVAGNLMIDLNPTNVKLRDRAARIVRELTGAGEEEARAALEANGWVIKQALRAAGKSAAKRRKNH